jgi:glycerate kinase
MKFVLAPDSFKESMTAAMAAAAMSRGIRAVFPDAECVEVPMADGGEGFTEALAEALGAELITTTVRDALGRDMKTVFAHHAVADLSIIEVAAAAGLGQVADDERDIMRASSYGVGQLITAALECGARRLIVGLGGSATNDGGAGMLRALGARFFATDRRELDGTPAQLRDLAFLDLSDLDPRLAQTTIEVASDVTNPLLGPGGASATFGPQKGASPDQVRELDGILAILARVAGHDGPGGLAEQAGAGAAGGLGYAFIAFLGARLAPGVELVAEVTGLANKVTGADFVFTGEGSMDAQTVLGKTPFGVARVAAAAGAATIGFAGRVEEGAEALYNHGILALVPIVPGPVDLPTALADGPVNLQRATEMVCRLLMATRR